MNCNLKKSCSHSESGLDAVFVPPSVKTESVASSTASLDTSMTALREASGLDSRNWECKSTELASANAETNHPVRVLNGSLQLF